MQYSFEIQEATDYGVSESIMIWNFRFWILKNKANNKHLYEGRTWTYNTHEAFQRLFPFWTKDQVRRIIEKLIQKDILIKGNFNENTYNKTTWYAFAEESKFMSTELIISHMADLPNRNGENAKSKWQNREMDVAKTGNGTGKNAKYIKETDIKPDIKPYSFSKEQNADQKSATKSDLEEYKKEKKYLSDVEDFFLHYGEKNWKGIENRYICFDRWEKRFKKLNPSAYIEPKPIGYKTKLVEESEEIKELRSRIPLELDKINKRDAIQLFGKYCPIEKTESGFVIYVTDKRALEFQECLNNLDLTIIMKRKTLLTNPNNEESE